MSETSVHDVSRHRSVGREGFEPPNPCVSCNPRTVQQVHGDGSSALAASSRSTETAPVRWPHPAGWLAVKDHDDIDSGHGVAPLKDLGSISGSSSPGPATTRTSRRCSSSPQ
jgi:hypothetical protein